MASGLDTLTNPPTRLSINSLGLVRPPFTTIYLGLLVITAWSKIDLVNAALTYEE